MTAEVAQRDEFYMRRCIQLARGARSRGNTPVGALLVAEGRVIAEAGETWPSELDPAGHAEMIVIRKALQSIGRRNLTGARLYTTKEPCWMCSYAIRTTRIAGVVVGQSVPEVGGATSVYPILRTTAVPQWGPPPDLLLGVLAAECAALHEA